MYRHRGGILKVFLVHPGGPYWAKKDLGSWSIPKGEFTPDEDPLEAARREFEEETGSPATGHFKPLTPIRQPGGKLVHAWAFEGDCDPSAIKSNTFSMEWPPHSGKYQEFPEVPIIIAHAGFTILTGEAFAVAKASPNIYLESSWLFADDLKWLISALGAERVMMGADLPRNVGPALAICESAGLTVEEKRLYLGGTARNLYKIER